MHRRIILAIVLAVAVCGISRRVLAGPPSYLLLQRASTPHRHLPGEPGAVAYAAPARGYAYGWFGVAPPVHPQRHVGSYRANIDWRFW